MSLLPGLDTRLEAGSVIPPRQGPQEQVPFAVPSLPQCCVRVCFCPHGTCLSKVYEIQ